MLNINDVLIFKYLSKAFQYILCKLSGYETLNIRIFPHATMITFTYQAKSNTRTMYLNASAQNKNNKCPVFRYSRLLETCAVYNSYCVERT